MSRAARWTRRSAAALAGVVVLSTTAAIAAAAPGGSDFPPFEKVSEGYSQVVSTADGAGSLYDVYRRNKDGQLLAVLPRGYERQKLLIATTVASGDRWAGFQGTGRDWYVYWKRYDDRLALLTPNLSVRSSGDAESRASVERTFTDRVLLDIPIVSMAPGGRPVIDLDGLLLGNSSTFFGSAARGINSRLAKITKAKAFPENIEITMQAPAANGVLREYAYSIRLVPRNPSYKPRPADNRVGYFQTPYLDLGKYNSEDKWIRYINRWHLEKRDPRLKLSPPKEPIVFYVEHTVPVRYRAWVKQGAEYWNKAFEAVGFRDAIKIEFQDKQTGAHMDKDPEDSRYNFIVWLSNDISTAIGPSRAHPETGEILDADIVLTDGWLRVFAMQWEDVMSQILMEGMTPETHAWLARRPQWDPRIRLADPDTREQRLAQARARVAMPVNADGSIPDRTAVSPTLFGQPAGIAPEGHILSDANMCAAADGKAYAMALMRTHLEFIEIMRELELAEPKDDESDDNGEGDNAENGDENDVEPELPEEPTGDVLDGVPEEFVGPLLADLVAHEVGHTLGLRHNFAASSIYTLDEINSEELKGNGTWTNSVMDYHPLNVNLDPNRTQGDYAPITIGAYDMWAIEYGYGSEDPKKVAARSSDPKLIYHTDWDTFGPDPLARRYDLSKDPLDYAKAKMDLARFYRARLLDKYVKDGEPWSRARRGYQLSISEHGGALSIMANWIGGAHVSKDYKGTPNARTPITPVPAEQQRRALNFVIQNAFYDEAFGLTPDLLRHLTILDYGDPGGQAGREPVWPVHDRVLGIQSSMLTSLMNPTTLRRVYDNEFLVPEGEDALTLAELITSVTDAIWEELDAPVTQRYSARKPLITSMRRNLQAEHVERLIDLSMPESMMGAAAKPVSNLALVELRDLESRMNEMIDQKGSRLDPYTKAHLSELALRINKAVDAQYIYNTDAISSGGGMPFLFFGNQPQNEQDRAADPLYREIDTR